MERSRAWFRLGTLLAAGLLMFSDPAAWRTAHLYLGNQGSRFFYVLNQLNRL